MELRTASSPRDVKTYDTARLREEFLIQDLFRPDEVKMVYSHIDRIITGAAMPVNKALTLAAGEELRAEYFLQRREMGIINIGGEGKVTGGWHGVYPAAPGWHLCGPRLQGRGDGERGQRQAGQVLLQQHPGP